MSYCRFSSDDYKSDVYVYESDEGYITHVASQRPVFKEPLPEPVEWQWDGDNTAFFARERKVRQMVREAEHAPIGLSQDGTTFVDDTPGECVDRLKQLRDLGYYIPQHAINALEEESDV